MQIDYKETAEFLLKNDNYVILTHQSPDGDTMGSGFGLCMALRKMGKKANVLCSDEFPKRYDFMHNDYEIQKFTPDKIIAVDVADINLLGQKLFHYGDYVDLCIDHHKSNTGYAKNTLLNSSAAAACEVLYELLVCMKAPIDTRIAECIYTGIATDTGCFKYSNTTRRAHIISAELMDYNVPMERINRDMFDVKSKARINVESYITSNTEYYLDDKCAMIAITREIIDNIGATADDFEGIASLTLQLESVQVGVTIKERKDGKFKVSMRSTSDVDVSDICSKYGGGGHAKAAGCLFDDKLEDVKLKVLSSLAPAFGMDLWLV